MSQISTYDFIAIEITILERLLALEPQKRVVDKEELKSRLRKARATLAEMDGWTMRDSCDNCRETDNCQEADDRCCDQGVEVELDICFEEELENKIRSIVREEVCHLIVKGIRAVK